jgi:hypothetical protein
MGKLSKMTTQISDESFRFALDKALKEQGYKKAERNKKINDYMLVRLKDRDFWLDYEEKLARDAQKKEEVPLESDEQKNFISWFRQTYPEILIFAIPNGGTRYPAEAANLKAQGVTPGVPDLYIPEWHLWVEMKRKKGWELSEDQETIRRYLVEKAADSWILGLGCEDAKKKILDFL